MHSTVTLQESSVLEAKRTRSLIDLGTFLIVVMASAWVFYTPLRDSTHIMPYVEDDFYYYLKVAQNVSIGLGSTFDGITRTNGYHPLYFVVMVVLSKFAHGIVDVFRGMWLIWVVASAVTFLTARKLLERPGTGPFLTNAMALVFLIPCVHIFCQGMEVTLTLPLGLGLLLAFRSYPGNWTFWRSVGIGLLAALTVLSRLDAVFLVLMLLVFTLADPELRRGIQFRQLAGFAIGGAPLLIAYFLFNHFYFHTWMPVSGAAKQIKSTPWPTLMALKSAGDNATFLAVFLVFAVVAFYLVRKKLDPVERPGLAAAAVFPFIQIGVLSVLSDWPLWGWYYYSLRFALLTGFVLLITLPISAWIMRQTPWIKVAAYGLALLLFLRVHYKKEPSMDPVYDVALKLHAFEVSHPGIYALGGGAGMPGYIFTNPLFQTEGLMTDPGYLLHLRHQDDLITTLRGYGVRYYIAYEVLVPTVYDKQRDGKCYLATEPYNVGHATLRMRARLCGTPLVDFPSSEQVVVHIYDLTQLGAQHGNDAL